MRVMSSNQRLQEIFIQAVLHAKLVDVRCGREIDGPVMVIYNGLQYVGISWSMWLSSLERRYLVMYTPYDPDIACFSPASDALQSGVVCFGRKVRLPYPLFGGSIGPELDGCSAVVEMMVSREISC